MTQEERYETIVRLAVEYIITQAENKKVNSNDPYANCLGNKIDPHRFIFKLNRSISDEIKKQLPKEVW